VAEVTAPAVAGGGRSLGDPAGEGVETPMRLVNFHGRRATAITAISSGEESVAQFYGRRFTSAPICLSSASLRYVMSRGGVRIILSTTHLGTP